MKSLPLPLLSYLFLKINRPVLILVTLLRILPQNCIFTPGKNRRNKQYWLTILTNTMPGSRFAIAGKGKFDL